jgi:hypothetical protein
LIKKKKKIGASIQMHSRVCGEARAGFARCVTVQGVAPCRATSLIRKRTLLGPYNRPVPRAL